MAACGQAGLPPRYQAWLPPPSCVWEGSGLQPRAGCGEGRVPASWSCGCLFMVALTSPEQTVAVTAPQHPDIKKENFICSSCSVLLTGKSMCFYPKGLHFKMGRSVLH